MPAERRLAELEGIERDLAADTAEIEALANTWKSWSAILGQAITAPAGSAPAEAGAAARQILKKVLVGPIVVTPDARVKDAFGTNTPCWSFVGYSRFDGVVLGGLTRGETFSVVLRDRESGAKLKQSWDDLAATYRVPPIAGGSDASECGAVRSTEGPPKPPGARKRPGVAVALLDIA